MTPTKRLGIWMNHSIAHLMEFETKIKTRIVESDFNALDRGLSLSKGENLMHNKEQQKHAEYYKKLGAVIRNYDEVLLFGPTDAKVELFNILKEDHLFTKIKIEVKQADKMTVHQEHSFVRDHFAPHKFHPHTV